LGVTATGCMAIGKLGHYFFGIPELLCMIIALSVVTIYATFGGFTAVAITDVFQFIIFFIAIPVAFVIGLDEVGGYTNILKSLPESHLTMQSKDITLFASLAVFALIPNTTVPFVQRALVARNKSQLVKTFTSTTILMIPLYILVALIGFMTYIKNPNLQTDTVLFYFIKHYLPVGAVGFMIARLLAVIMSTQDSFLNTTSALIASDICKKIWPSLSVQKELIIARASCVLLAILYIFLLFIKEDILELIWFIANFWDPLVLTPFALALMGVRINKKFFFIIPIITLTSQIITRQIVGSFDTRSLAVGAITAAVSILIASYLHKKRRITWVN
jgi:SSS family solute:Na+ symporter